LVLHGDFVPAVRARRAGDGEDLALQRIGSSRLSLASSKHRDKETGRGETAKRPAEPGRRWERHHFTLIRPAHILLHWGGETRRARRRVPGTEAARSARSK